VIQTHVNVPYHLIDTYLGFIREEHLDLEIYFNSSTADSIRKDDIIALQRKLDYGPGLSIHAPFMDLSPGGVDPKVREVTSRRFSDVLDIAEILKPRTIVFHSGYDKWKYDSRVDIWLEGCIRTWKPVNKRAEALGINIAIENVFEDDPSHLKLLMQEMKSENFGLCFDSGHFNLFSRLTLTDWLDQIKQYIVEFHLHDNDGTADAHLALGDGSFDFTALFREVQDKNCLYTIEAHTVEGVKKSLNRLKELLKT
jgi:sugar phosphate isomerase/epimerase